MAASPFTLEICCFNLQSCQAAVAAGANRVELCADPSDGGTTPSSGLIQAAREVTRNAGVHLYPIIRPRGGDFLYTAEDYALMAGDIRMCAEAGCDGVVIGGLLADGRVDRENCLALVKAAGTMGVTFHRAFDRARDPFEALEDIIAIGCGRILTSGTLPTAMQGAALLSQLVARAAGRISIMPGGGVRADNILSLQAATGAREFHSAALIRTASAMQFINASLKEDLASVMADPQQVRQMRGQLDQLYHSKT